MNSNANGIIEQTPTHDPILFQTGQFLLPIDAIATPTLILAPDFTMIAANEALLRVTGRRRDEIVGHNVFEVFPDNPDDPTAEGVRNLRASLERVLRDKVSDTMAIQKYDIPVKDSHPLKFEERYWSPTNIPMLNELSEVTHILHHVNDVTAAIVNQDKQSAMASEIYSRTEEVRTINVQLKLAKVELERKVAERTAQLSASEARLLQATESAKVGAWEINSTLDQAWRSASHDRLFGYDQPLDDWTFQKFLEHIYPDDRVRVASDLSFEKEVWNSEFRIIQKDGSVHWMAVKGKVHRDETGKLLGASGLNLDITERKEAEIQTKTEKHKFEAIFQESPAAMALMRGPNLVFEKVNRRFSEMLGCRELIGLRFEEALSELHDQPFHNLVKSVFETGVPIIGTEAKAYVIRKPGSEREESYWDFAYIRILDGEGKPYGVYNHCYDVTDRVLSRFTLEQTQAELLRAKEVAESASRMKSAFLANMSHEIRTPLGAIIGYTDLLKEDKLDAGEREQFLDTISRSGRALTRLIDDILDLAKVEAGRLDIETLSFSIYDLLTDTVELFRENARRKGIFLLLNVEESTPAFITSDPSRLRQILINLIGNAIKFTDSGGVRVNVRCQSQADGSLEFKVDIKDTGIGLTDEQRERLFQPFAQADNSTTRTYGGTGLGLALSKRLSEALGGGIAISQCSPGKGCTFTLAFTARTANKEQAEGKVRNSDFNRSTHEIPAASLQGLRILAVDDSPENLLLVKRLLLKNGATVDTATNGEDALQKATHAKYDIILMDIQMPKMDGYQSKKAIDKMGYEGPIVALTAHAMKEERQRTQMAGFSAHLTKPLNSRELIETIGRLAIAYRLNKKSRSISFHL